MEKKNPFINIKSSKRRICMNCEVVVSEDDEKCWFCGVSLHFKN